MHPSGKKFWCKEQYPPPTLLSMTGGAIISFFSTFCSYICTAKIDLRSVCICEMQHNEGYRSIFTLVTMASKNKRATVSISTSTNYMQMCVEVLCSDMLQLPMKAQVLHNVQGHWLCLTLQFITVSQNQCDHDGISSLLCWLNTVCGWLFFFRPCSETLSIQI